MALFLCSLGACYVLAARLGVPDNARTACLLYGFAANALAFALDAGPVMLGTTCSPSCSPRWPAWANR
jgi:hypothetical protein